MRFASGAVLPRIMSADLFFRTGRNAIDLGDHAFVYE
jgi:hypothetical protein